MLDLFAVILGLSNGLVVGAAFAGFISMLDIIPRLVQISRTLEYRILYQNAFSLGVVAFTIIYLFELYVQLNNIMVAIVGLIFGTFIGMFSSALAEVLNVIPVMSKKLKIKDELKIIIYALLFGKIAGSLYYWLVIK